jgi:hypothetical protein
VSSRSLPRGRASRALALVGRQGHGALASAERSSARRREPTSAGPSRRGAQRPSVRGSDGTTGAAPAEGGVRDGEQPAADRCVAAVRGRRAAPPERLLQHVSAAAGLRVSRLARRKTAAGDVRRPPRRATVPAAAAHQLASASLSAGASMSDPEQREAGNRRQAGDSGIAPSSPMDSSAPPPPATAPPSDEHAHYRSTTCCSEDLVSIAYLLV